MGKPFVIVLGNEKGGTGKSTAAMHVIISLLRLGYSVTTIDVDARQGTLSRYIENRRRYIEKESANLPISHHFPLLPTSTGITKDDEQMDMDRLATVMHNAENSDFVVIDTPGSNTHLSRLAHSYADTLITPLNDSFIDLDMLIRLDDPAMTTLRPSVYAEMVWQQKKHRLARDGVSMDWIVMRNRLSNLNARNKTEMERILAMMSKRIGFRLVAGFGERVIFRELFPTGLTLLDLKDLKIPLTLSHVAAKQELRALLDAIALPHLGESLAKAV